MPKIVYINGVPCSVETEEEKEEKKRVTRMRQHYLRENHRRLSLGMEPLPIPEEYQVPRKLVTKHWCTVARDSYTANERLMHFITSMSDYEGFEIISQQVIPQFGGVNVHIIYKLIERDYSEV